MPKKKKKTGLECSNCGKSRWQTKEKNNTYLCRYCGYIRKVVKDK